MAKNKANQEKWICRAEDCNQEVSGSGAKQHFKTEHEDIWNQYREEYSDKEAWKKVKEDGYFERPSDSGDGRSKVELPHGESGKHSEPDGDFQRIEVDGKKYTPEELIWERGYEAVHHLMELKLEELLNETNIKNKNLILRQFRLYDAYKNPQNPQMLQSLISDLAPRATPGLIQTIVSEVFRVPWLYKDTIERAMRYNPAIFNPNSYPSAGFNNPFGTPNPNPNPSFNPNPMNPNPNRMAQDNPQPFWITHNSPYANPYSPHSNFPNNGGLTAADVRQLIREEFDRREREQREKEREEYIKDLEKKVDKLEKENSRLRSERNESGHNFAINDSKRVSGGDKDYDLTSPIDVLKFFNDFYDQMNKLGFAPNSNGGGGGESRPLNQHDVEMQRINNELEMKKEDRKAMEKSAQTVANALENVASNLGFGFGKAMSGGFGAGAGAGSRAGSGAGPAGARIWIEGNQIVGVCPRCGSRIQAPTNTTKITCRNCNTVIYNKERQRQQEQAEQAGAEKGGK